MQINRKTVNVCTVGMVVYKRIVVDLIFLNFAFKLFLPVFSPSPPPAPALKDAHSKPGGQRYVFIYLFIWFPSSSKLPRLLP